MGASADTCRLGCRSGLIRIAVLAGDGIGPEVVQAALAGAPPEVITVPIDVSAERYLATGELLLSSEVQEIKDSDALCFGAIGDPRVPDGVLERGILLRL